MYTQASIIEAGRKLRHTRNQYGLTLEDVEKRTREKFGASGTMNYNKLSRIERGKIAGPPSIDDISAVAWVYNLNPAEVMGWYGMPTYVSEKVAEPPVITQAKLLLQELSPAQQQKLISLFEFAIAQVRTGAA